MSTDHDCLDWNSGGACCICRRPLSVEEQQRGMEEMPVGAGLHTIRHAIRLLRWWADDESDDDGVVEIIRESIECADELSLFTEAPEHAFDVSEVATAETIAILAHYGQVTRSEGMVYLHHPAAVAASVPAEYKAVAWLHDVLEDSAFTSEHLLAAGIERTTVEAVKLLTRQPPFDYDEYIARIACSENRAAITVKLADLRHNLRPSCPDDLAARYRRAVPRLEAALARLTGTP